MRTANLLKVRSLYSLQSSTDFSQFQQLTCSKSSSFQSKMVPEIWQIRDFALKCLIDFISNIWGGGGEVVGEGGGSPSYH